MGITEKQSEAIMSDGSNILVSASAGSGKTFVMIERVKRLILQKGIDIDKILCVTFTVLAAKEMKQKLTQKITEALKTANEQDAKRLKEQLELLPTASISTMHAFCKNLLSEFFYEAGLDPAFTILDDKNAKLLINRAIDQLFEDLYESKDSDLQILLPYLFKGRRDKALKEKIVSVYKTIISEANPREILQKGEFYYTESGVDFIADYFYREIIQKASAVNRLIDRFLPFSTAYVRCFDYLNKTKDCFNKILACENYEKLYEGDIKFPSKPKATKNTSEEEKEFLEELSEISSAVKDFKEFKNEYETQGGLAGEKARVSEILPVYKAFEKIVFAFMDYFAKLKREENAVDYSDLEHFTLKLLKNEEIKNEISSRYKYIFTDEYQDTSGVQEAILTAIANDNLFMVGDLKQSIYDFRGCNPDIFADKYEKYEKSEGGVAIRLDKNFRSTPAVLKAVNNLFSNIMTEDCGRINYKKDPMQVGASYPEGEGETVMYTAPKSKAEKILPEGVYSVIGHLNVLKENGCFSEGRMVAELIENLIDKEYYDIKEEGENKIKKIGYGDIAILLRDANKDADLFTTELVRAGIPVSAPSKDSIGNYAEIVLAVNILQLINCYNQDVPLAAVLKSEIGKVTDSEFLQIRKFTPEGSFASAVQEYAKHKEDELSIKLNGFINYFNNLRVLAEFVPCGELLSEIVAQNGIDLKLLSSRLGDIKVARLNKFIEIANASKQTVSEFLVGIDELLEKLTMSFTSEQTVKIMSIHASKGLEFPIVILAKTTKKFNMESIKGDFLSDRYYGVSIDYRNLQSMQLIKSLFNKFVKKIKTNRMREEEMRLLYVAMTRAKNSLYLTGEYSNEKDAFPAEEHSGSVYEADKYFKMFAQTDFEVKPCTEIKSNFEGREVRQVLISEYDEYMVNTIAKNISFEYPYIKNANLSVKRSVTQASHFEEEDQTPFEKAPIYSESNTETGNAYHKFLELSNFNLEPETAFNRVIEGDLMPIEYKNLIEKEKAVKILQMPVFKEIKDYTLYKEQPFTAFMPANIVEEDYSGEEEILIQGIIDLLCIKDESAVIIDYKHSSVFNDEKLIQRYKKQLKLYSYAVEKVLGKKVEKTYLVNVNYCKCIPVEL